jgi:hypothetical protein
MTLETPVGRGTLVVRVYKNDWFAKFARKERISDAALCEAVGRAGKGLVDAELGSGLVKQRVAREGAGKSGGYRTLIFFRQADRAIFAYGFAKSDQANLTDAQLAAFRKASKIWLGLSQGEIDLELEAQTLLEVHDDHEDL